MLDKFKNLAGGYGTYAAIIGGLVVATLGFLYGPVDLPGSFPDIPALSSDDYFKFLWEGVVLAFLRRGVGSLKK